MKRRVQGILKNEIDVTSETGYKPVWETGRGARAKRQQRLAGPNRPSV